MTAATDPFDSPEYDAWCDRQEARGELAGSPEEMDCYGCGGFDGVTKFSRKVTALGPVIGQGVDPTQTFVLECGHTAF